MDVLSTFKLDGKTAIVTGGGQGIGRELALGLAEAGSDVVVVQRNQELAENTAEDIRAMGRKSLGLKVDLQKEADVKDMVEQRPWSSSAR
jgi:NAD(P)-dependent dehydrogenase (short-subunit alcohol dehydrogenase family)